MAFAQAYLPIQKFANRYGKTSRTYEAIRFFAETSNANTTISIDSNTFLAMGSQAGKKREVKLVYFPISCDEGGSCEDNVCDTAEVVEPKAIWFNITECTASKVFAVNAENIRQVDAQEWDFNEVAMNIMLSHLPAFRLKLAKAMITKAYALAGQHADGNETHQVVNLTTAAGRVNPMGLFGMQQEYDDLGLNEPRVLGGGDFFDVAKLTEMGGLNDDGIYINRLTNTNVYYDNGLQGKLFNDLVNGNWGLSVSDEVFKMVTYSRNAGQFRTDLGSPDDLATLRRQSTIGSIHGTFLDEATGLIYDYDAKYDDCTDQWKFQWRLEWDFFVLPEVVCNDTIGTVNGLMKWRTCPQVIADCPEGQSPSVPATVNTYTWTPSGGEMTSLANIFQSTIDGYIANQTTPVAIADRAALVAYMNDNSNITFRLDGTAIEYDGTEDIAATFNAGAVTANFA